MKFPFFASFIILCLVVHHAISRNSKLQKKSETAFWMEENAANNIRKQSLDGLDYVSFSSAALLPETLLDSSSCKTLMEEPRVRELTDSLKALEEKKIVNLNYITNTELKTTYGVANLPLLTEYDQNYTDLITLLQEYASLLAKKGYTLPALTVLETAFGAKTDITASYSLAASLYRKQGRMDKIEKLLSLAEELDSPRKNAIVRTLRKADPDNG